MVMAILQWSDAASLLGLIMISELINVRSLLPCTFNVNSSETSKDPLLQSLVHNHATVS